MTRSTCIKIKQFKNLNKVSGVRHAIIYWESKQDYTYTDDRMQAPDGVISYP